MKNLIKSALLMLLFVSASAMFSCKNAETTVTDTETTMPDNTTTDMPATVDTTGVAPVDTTGTGIQKMP